jgi:hypothetical protein
MTYSHLWNDMRIEERARLHPYMIETHILHLQQARAIIVRSHQRELKELDDWIRNLQSALPKEEASLTSALPR